MRLLSHFILAVAAIGSLSALSAQQLITVNPNPPVAGQKMTIQYQRGAKNNAIKLEITYDNEPPICVTIPAGGNEVEVTVPLDAEGLLIVDTTGASADYTTAIDYPDDDVGPPIGMATRVSMRWVVDPVVRPRPITVSKSGAE